MRQNRHCLSNIHLKNYSWFYCNLSYKVLAVETLVK